MYERKNNVPEETEETDLKGRTDLKEEAQGTEQEKWTGKTDLKGRPMNEESTPGVEEEKGRGKKEKVKTVYVEKKVKEKKSSGGCLKGCLIVVVVLLFLLAFIVAGLYFGYGRIVKGMEPVDLGVEYTLTDYTDLMDEIGVEADETVLCIDCPTPEFSEPEEVEVTVSDAQASAAFQYINKHLSSASVSDTQIKMGDGFAELSTNLTFEGNTFPVYMKGSIARASSNSIDGKITSIKIGSIKIPEQTTSYVAGFLLDIANDKLAAAHDTVRIDDIDIKPEGLNFKGLVPTKIQ